LGNKFQRLSENGLKRAKNRALRILGESYKKIKFEKAIDLLGFMG